MSDALLVYRERLGQLHELRQRQDQLKRDRDSAVAEHLWDEA
jgi:hypothetical protein